MAVEVIETRAIFMTHDSESLAARVKSGDVGAFHVVFEQNHRLVLRFLCGLSGCQDLAEELAQETFIKAFQSINTLKDESKLPAWLCGIARNVAFNYFRSRRMLPKTASVDEEFLPAVFISDSAPDNEMLSRELNTVIEDAIKRLDDDKRLVFTLKMLRQLSYHEIAEITGSSIGKLKTDYRRAKIEMRKLVGPYLGGTDEL